MPKPSPEVLAAALLWLRNHYYCDAGPTVIRHRGKTHRGEVLARIDAVLDDTQVFIGDMKKFRRLYPFGEEKDDA